MAQTMGREQLFYRILVFFAVFTAFTGLLNLAQTGQITLGSFGNGYVPGQAVPQIGLFTSTPPTNIQDYTTDTGYVHNMTVIETNLFGDLWTRSDGVGYTSGSAFTSNQAVYLSILSAVTQNGIYDNTYNVINSDPQTVIYTPLYAAVDGSGFASGTFVRFDNNGISLVKSNEYVFDTPFNSISFPSANMGRALNVKYNPSTGIAVVVIDGATGGSLTVPPPPDYLSVRSYAGLATSKSGVVISSVTGSFQILQLHNLITDTLAAVTEFVTMLGAIFGLSSSALVPFWVWAIIGLPCIATLTLISLELARGN